MNLYADRAVAYTVDENGVEKPIGLIIKNCDILTNVDGPIQVRLDCRLDEKAMLEHDGFNPPTKQPLDTIQHMDGSMTWREHRNSPDGRELRTVYASPWALVERTDCFCCSCSDNNPDPHCRNHGWAGRRACGKHNQSGQDYEQEKINHTTGDLYTVMETPQSIEEYRGGR